MDPTYPLYPFFAFIGFLVVLVPLPWHLQAWNAGTCLYMLWTSLACLNLFVNSIVWHDNALNPAPVWCDISSRLILGVAVAIPAASLCINRRLYKIATMMSLGTSSKQKRRAVCEDLSIGLGIPVIQMALQYIVSAHRFNIFEDIGCLPVTYNVWLAYPLSATWPIVIGLVSATYCVLTLRALYKRSTEFNELFAMSPSFSVNRYFRLMALASTELLCTTPLAAYSIYLNLTTGPLIPYRGWADLHFNYSQVDQFPAVIWHLNHQVVISLELNRWLVVACAFIFFGFFGFAEEARNNYRALFLRTASRFGYTPQSRSAATHSNPYRFNNRDALPDLTNTTAMTETSSSLSPVSTISIYSDKPLPELPVAPSVLVVGSYIKDNLIRGYTPEEMKSYADPVYPSDVGYTKDGLLPTFFQRETPATYLLSNEVHAMRPDQT